MIISKFKRELNGDISEIRLNTGEKLQNVEYLTDLEEKTVTENGTYTPSTGKVGFSKVVVNVPSAGGDISILNSTIEGFQGGAYGVILCDENGCGLKITDINTFDLTRVKYIWEGHEYSADLWDLTEVTDLRYDSESECLLFTALGNEQSIGIDKVETTLYPLYKYLAHSFS